jgi:uncharacterized protein
MKIDLKQIGASGISIERTIPATEGPRSGGGEACGTPRLLTDAALRLSVERAGERFHLRGTLEAEVEVACGRCLAPFSFAVRPQFDYYLVPRRQVDLWAEVEIDDAAKREVEVDSLELDLLHLADEQLRLGLPMKPLCSEACQGICLCCGADLNQDACGCREDESDHSGLDVLSGLLERMKDDTSVS